MDSGVAGRPVETAVTGGADPPDAQVPDVRPEPWDGGGRPRSVHRRHLAAVGGSLLLLTGCSGLDSKACTAIGPPFGLTFLDVASLNEPAQPADGPVMVDLCADDVCEGTYVRTLGADPAATGGDEIADPLVFSTGMGATPTAHLRLHDDGGPPLREVSTPVAARAVSSDVNGPECLSQGYWGAVRVAPDGTLVDVTADTPLPGSLQPL